MHRSTRTLLALGAVVAVAAAGRAQAAVFNYTDIVLPQQAAFGGFANGVASDGTVIGTYFDSNANANTGFTWNSGTLTSLGTNSTLDPNGSSSWNGINASGVFVGNYFDTNNSAFVNAGSYVSLGAISPGNTVSANGINNLGTIVGSITDATSFVDSGFLYNVNTLSFTSIADPNSTRSTDVYGISDNGRWVVGDYDSGTTKSGFIYDVLNNVFTTLNFPGMSNTTLHDINDNGDIVGTFTDSSFQSFGFLYTQGQFITATADPSNPFAAPLLIGINNSGLITGYYQVPDSEFTQSFVLNVSVPEPTTFALLLPGLAVVGTLRRRRAA